MVPNDNLREMHYSQCLVEISTMCPMQLPQAQDRRTNAPTSASEIENTDKEDGVANETGNRYWTIPNFICFGRILGSFALIGIAIADLPYWFVGLYLVLAVSDLIDGPIARLLDQRSDLGAGLDSLADLLLSSCLVVGVSILCWDVMEREIVYVGVAVASYIVASGYGYWKFKRVPSFHTYSAKATHLLVAISGTCLVLGWSVWPLRAAAIAVLLTNIESLAISRKLTRWKTDVPSIFHA